jgi:beta-lactamase regulating signal transducer with metallopeptidase domain
MQDLIANACANAIVAAVLAGAAWAAARFVRRPALTHALCVLILLKLVTPPLFELTLSAPVLMVEGLKRLGNPTANSLGSGRVGQAALVIWLVGSAAWFLLQLRWTLRLRAAVDCATPAPPDVVDSANRIAKQMGLRRSPPVRLLTAAHSPMLCGFGPRVCIILPVAVVERLAPAAQDTIVAHELAHFKRCDHWVRVVEMIATGCFWWHPAVWWARRQIEAAEEQCCDALVMEHCSGQKRAYAEAILDVIDWNVERRRGAPPLLASALGGRTRLAGRLRDLLNEDRPHRVGRGGSAFAAAAALLLIVRPELDWPSDDSHHAKASPDKEIVASVAEKTLPNDIQNVELQRAWATAIAPNGAFECAVRPGYRCELTELATGRVHSLKDRQVTCAAFVGDGEKLVVGDQEGSVRLIDAASGGELGVLLTGSSPICSLDVSAASNQIAAADDSSRVMMAYLDSPAVNFVWTCEAPIRCLRFSPDGRRLAMALGVWQDATPGGVEVIDLASRQMVRRWTSPTAVGAVRYFSNDGLLTADWAGNVDCYRISDGRWLGSTVVRKEFASAEAFSPHVDALARMARQFDAVMRRDSVW